MISKLKILPALALLLMLASCNTFDGMGRDMQRSGDAVRDAAN